MAACVLAVLTGLQVVLYGAIASRAIGNGLMSDDPTIVVLSFVTAGFALLTVVLLARATHKAFRIVRYPPRLSTHGIRVAVPRVGVRAGALAPGCRDA